MTFAQLLEKSEKAGLKSIAEQDKCFSDGGHIRAKAITINRKPAYKCWCGFAAIVTAPIWKKIYQCCYCLNEISEFPDLVVSPDELVCEKCR
jgi:hypothetical protein